MMVNIGKGNRELTDFEQKMFNDGRCIACGVKIPITNYVSKNPEEFNSKTVPKRSPECRDCRKARQIR
jgi:hypothetical protein